jgi:pimeloyl-ACP methyl ester carboxylesterase
MTYMGAIRPFSASRRNVGKLPVPAIEPVPPTGRREMANGISGARLLIVPESGHLSPLEQPTAVTQALIDRLGTPMAPGDN